MHDAEMCIQPKDVPFFCDQFVVALSIVAASAWHGPSQSACQLGKELCSSARPPLPASSGTGLGSGLRLSHAGASGKFTGCEVFPLESFAEMLCAGARCRAVYM